jgi:AraC family transcriptional regulator of adaptative response/methylated-DNA-[protein]-cysteine methyltransferase
MEPPGESPAWLAPLLAEVEADPSLRWRDADLRARGLAPTRVRRWFRAQHGLTF